VSNKLYVQLYGKDVTSEALGGTTRLASAAIGEVLNRVYNVLIWLMSAHNHRAETPLTPPPLLICSALLEDANHSRGALPTLSPILLGPVFSAGLELSRPTRESAYLIVPTWLSSQAHSKARSRIWS
jgi:hypothetical protein